MSYVNYIKKEEEEENKEKCVYNLTRILQSFLYEWEGNLVSCRIFPVLI